MNIMSWDFVIGPLNTSTMLRAVQLQFYYSMAGLVLGLLCIIGGIVLFVLGINGSITWITKLSEVESSLYDAAPGAVLFIVGVLVVWITRFIVKHKNS